MIATKLWLPGMDPNAPATPAPRPLTIREYFDQTFLPEATDRGLSRDRIGELKQAVHRWEWWCRDGTPDKDGTMSPVLTDVTPMALCEFRKSCLARELPGRDGRMRVVTPRSLNKTLQAIEQILAAAIEDGTLDESRGIVRVRKVAQPRQVNKLVLTDEQLAAIIDAAKKATWPHHATDGRPIDAPTMWQTAIVLFAIYGMRTQDLLRYDTLLRPIRWGCVRPAGPSPAEDGTLDSDHGWLSWVPNKTDRVKSFAMCLPLSATARHWLDRWREAMPPTSDTDPLMPIPMTKDSVYASWRAILSEANVKPKPKIEFDESGNVIATERGYLLKHLRCTAGTRAEEHASSLHHQGVGRWITGHVSNDVFERHYRGMERAIKETIETMPMPVGFSPETAPERPRLRIVG